MLAFPLVLISALTATVSASPLAERQSGVQIIRNCYVPGTVALTFDDGPFWYDGDVARALNGGKGTFFFNGNNYDCIYNHVDLVRQLDRDQHTLASHSWSHKNMAQLSYNEIHDELARVEEAFIRILGKKPLYFRPPYGAYNDLVLQVLGERGYKKMILWSADLGDANGESTGYSIGVLNGVADQSPNPALVLSHSTIQTTSSQVLPATVGRLQSAGYRLVAVDTCLGNDGEWPYQWVQNPGTPDGSWRC